MDFETSRTVSDRQLEWDGAEYAPHGTRHLELLPEQIGRLAHEHAYVGQLLTGTVHKNSSFVQTAYGAIRAAAAQDPHIHRPDVYLGHLRRFLAFRNSLGKYGTTYDERSIMDNQQALVIDLLGPYIDTTPLKYVPRVSDVSPFAFLVSYVCAGAERFAETDSGLSLRPTKPSLEAVVKQLHDEHQQYLQLARGIQGGISAAPSRNAKAGRSELLERVERAVRTPSRLLACRPVGRLVVLLAGSDPAERARYFAAAAHHPVWLVEAMKTRAEQGEAAAIRRRLPPELRGLSLPERAMRTEVARLIVGGVGFAPDAPLGSSVELKGKNAIPHVVATAGRMLEHAGEKHGAATKNQWRGNYTLLDRFTLGKSSLQQRLEDITPQRFHGQLRDNKIILLPIDEYFMQTYAPAKTEEFKKDVQDGYVRRLAIVSDMCSTGKGRIGQSVIDVVVRIKDALDPGNRSVEIKMHGSATGDRIAALLGAESRQVSTILTAVAAARPLSGGLVERKR